MKKILLIEDDTMLRENTAELLELSGYSVNTAPNGKHAIEHIKDDLPNIVICDIMMPELDGYGVLEALSKDEDTKYIPFIFLSAKTERKDVRKGMELGADDYIPKPFQEDELINAIESRLAKSEILKDQRASQEMPVPEANADELETLNDLKNFFDDNGDVICFQKGDTIYEEGQNSNFIYLITKGSVKSHKLDELGKDLTTSLYNEDDLFGYASFSQDRPYQETATAIVDTEVACISKKTLKDLLDNNHKIALELMQLLTNDILGIKDQLLQMAYSSVNKKTASTIIKFAEKLNHDTNKAITISRSDLASVAGIAPETLIRTLSNFKKQGIIEIKGKNIRILDLERLQDMH
ncbi:response regulator [Mangrovimonas sp. YM274]|uniref:response regulator n=1 Tax=Mangrovimonas sp. YM274 TaxID=3070660 RepID=UPI0027DCFDE9|nr:response regulator [Mangrovimonas sp. YM274]WMI68087.1 response regulator [Mangrovimonas sp. YM274]